MKARFLNQLDLNLLVALDVLLRERHVSRAADRLGLSQPAMSAALRRLRDALEDPILVRSGGTMVPTPYALSLEIPLRESLERLEQVLSITNDFAPTESNRQFRVGLFDQQAPLLLPGVLDALHKQAPRVQLEVLTLQPTLVHGQVRAGELDLAVFVYRKKEQGLCSRLAWDEQMVSIVRRDHPLSRSEKPTLEEFCAWPHATIRFSENRGTLVDSRLEQVGLKRNIVARIPYFMAAPAMVSSSDLVMTVPMSAALLFQERWPIQLVHIPELHIGFQISFVWSAALDGDPGLRWMIERFQCAARDVQGRVQAGIQRYAPRAEPSS